MRKAEFQISDCGRLNLHSALLSPHSSLGSRGVSIIAAIFIIVILAFMGLIFVSLISTGSYTAVNEMQATQALYVAEGGLENAVILLNTPTLANRITCAQVNANLNAKTLGAGQFTASGTTVYSSPSTILNGALTSAATTVTVNSTAGYAQYGRIMIDRELIDYSGTTANSFLNAVRGRDGTTAAAHANGAPVGQYQCTITSQGGIPSVASPSAMRTVAEGVQLQEGWFVGAAGGVGFQPLYGRFNGVTWSLFSPSSVANVQMNSISMLSYVDGWAVGNNGGVAGGCPNTNGRIFRWNGSSWSCVASPSNQSLQSVFMVSASDGWAVGYTGVPAGGCTNNRPRMLRWNGAAWSCLTPLSVNQNLYSVYMIDTNQDGTADDGWAVGNSNGTRPLVGRWNIPCAGGAGTGVWNTCNNVAYVPNINISLYSVFMVSQNDGWAVGGGGTILRWTGAAPWISVASGVAQQLNSVYMLDTNNNGTADDGWAVGVRNGTRPTVLRWNVNCNGVGTTGAWNNCTAAPYVPAINQNLNGVQCVDASDCWAVGNAGLILHWDGTTWSQNSAGLTGQNLQEVYVIGPRQRPQAAWQEVVN